MKPPFPYKEEGPQKLKISYGPDGKYIPEKPNIIAGIREKSERKPYKPIANPYEGGKDKFLV